MDQLVFCDYLHNRRGIKPLGLFLGKDKLPMVNHHSSNNLYGRGRDESAACLTIAEEKVRGANRNQSRQILSRELPKE